MASVPSGALARIRAIILFSLFLATRSIDPVQHDEDHDAGDGAQHREGFEPTRPGQWRR
jgi:hypothetical protein